MFFQVNDKLCMGAETYRTRYSWGHKAHLYRVRRPEHNDELIESVKVTYYNRTWERYEFESALYQLVDKALKNREITKDEHKTLTEYIKNYQEPNRYRGLEMIAKMGDILTDNKKDANDWKARMLKAGLPEGAIEMPEDWDSLDEETKEARLNGAIAILAK